MNRPFTKDLYSDDCLHHNIEGQKKQLVPGCEAETTYLTCAMLHTKHTVKQGLTTVVALVIYLNRENSVSRFIKTKMHHV